MTATLLVNGFANNAIIPIANKVQTVYDLSGAYVNAPITASFLVYSFSNFPANYIIDKHGLRVSFLIGSGMYALGLLLFALINKGYHFVLIGSILAALGQPFIINCPAKVATYWFLNKNVKKSNILENFCNRTNDRLKSLKHRYEFHAPNLGSRIT